MTTTSPLVEFKIPDIYHTDRSQPVRWILSHAKRYWYLLFGGLAGSILNAALGGLTPVLIGQAFNLMQNDPGNIKKLGILAMYVAATQALRALSQYGRNLSFESTAQLVERNVRDELYASLIGKSMTFHSLQPIGNIMAKATNDVREVNYFFSPGLTMVLGSIVFLIIPIVYSIQYHISLITVPLLFIFVYFWSIRQYLKKLSPVTESVRSNFGELNIHLAESIDGIEIVKGAARETEEVANFMSNARKYRNAVVKQGDVEAVFIPMLLMAFAVALGLLHALVLFKLGLINLGAVVSYFGLLLMLDFPTFSSLHAYSRISLGVAGARRILGLMNQEDNIDQNLKGATGALTGEIEFRNVSFRYGFDSAAVLKNISFKVKSGQRVAIVGQTGSGKTTLCRLINRTYDTSSGEVLIDGIDVRNWNLGTLRQNISIIEQDIFLFSRSINKNITFGKPDASLEAVINAAKSAQADEFINTFPDKYETIIGE
ncbi:MAG: ABC transporter ATP-binding protein, partial [Anaerolineaceae bacterium]